MDRQERLDRIAELQRWIEAQHEEFRDEAFPDDVAQLWETHNAELDVLQREQQQLEARDKRLRQLSQRDENVEPSSGGYLSNLGSNGGSTRRGDGAPTMISRMTTDQVYDLSGIRVNLAGDGGASELRERALRAADLDIYPDHIDRELAKQAVSRLLNREDDDIQGSLIARRILTTGHPDYKRAFARTMSTLLKGSTVVNLTGNEQRAMEAVRAMAALTGSTGGFAVPYTLDPTIIPTSNLSVNPYRGIARVEQVTVNEWRGVTSAGVTASYAGESAPASDNSPTLAQPAAIVQRAQCFVPVSIELTQDWGALQTELANLIQDAKDDLEAVQFSTGVGTTVFPQGLITGSTNTVAAGGVASFAVADLYNLETGLPPRFRPRAQFIGNRFTYNKVRQFDTAGGASLWTPLPAPLQQGLANQVPRGGNTGYDLIGYPSNECSGLAAVLTTGAKILVLGDPRYFLIVDRVGMDIEVIPHIFQTVTGTNPQNVVPLGQRGFYAFWRNTSKVLDANAFRVLVTG